MEQNKVSLKHLPELVSDLAEKLYWDEQINQLEYEVLLLTVEVLNGRTSTER
jgi:hypothetical protein